MTVLEQFVRRTAKRITRNGAAVLITDGDPLLTAAFAELGWPDPYEELNPGSAPAAVAREEVAVEQRAPEQAIVVHPTER
jgi:hypothetical protein